MTAPISEIFSSIQGEGLLCGERHIFIRFSGCNLRCTYCDTPANQHKTYGTLYSVEEVCTAIQSLAFPCHLHSAAVCTGGEPLLWHTFIKLLAPRVHAMGLPVYLETNGTLPDAFADVMDEIDIVAADFKLAQYTEGNLWDAQQKFFDLLNQSGKEHFIKIVFSDEITPEVMKDTCLKLKHCSIQCPIVLQPMTQHTQCVTQSTLDTFQRIALVHFPTQRVLVIPQVHTMLHVR